MLSTYHWFTSNFLPLLFFAILTICFFMNFVKRVFMTFFKTFLVLPTIKWDFCKEPGFWFCLQHRQRIKVLILHNMFCKPAAGCTHAAVIQHIVTQKIHDVDQFLPKLRKDRKLVFCFYLMIIKLFPVDGIRKKFFVYINNTSPITACVSNILWAIHC